MPPLSTTSSQNMSEVTVEANGGITPRGMEQSTEWAHSILSLKGEEWEDVCIAAARLIEMRRVGAEESRKVGALTGLLELVEKEETPPVRAKVATAMNALSVLCESSAETESLVEANLVEIVCTRIRKIGDPLIRSTTTPPNERNVQYRNVRANGDDTPPKKDTTVQPLARSSELNYETLTAGALLLSRTVAESNEGRSRLLRCRALDILSYAALREETRKARVACSMAIATMGTWAGPQNAAEIVETPFVLPVIEQVLRDVCGEFSSSLKCAMIDAVSVMASRNKARGILLRNDMGQAVMAAVTSASDSKDLFLAAKASVAAGALKGKTVDKFGFVVEAKRDSSIMSGAIDGSSVEGQGNEGGNLSGNQTQQQTQYESVLKTQYSKRSPAGSSDCSDPQLLDLGNYLSLATATAAATSGVPLSGQEDKKSIDMWLSLLESNNLATFRSSDKKLLPYLRKLARVGIPQSLRCRVWPLLLQVDELKKKYEGLYEKSLQAPLPDSIVNDIDKDATRTMPSHELFWSGGAQVGLKSLRNVLRAYAAATPEVGYCQGMSSICALFLVNSSVEEEAFLMFLAFMEQYEYKGLFEPGLPALFVMLNQLEYTIEKLLPSISRTFEHEGVKTQMFVDKWFMTGFTYCFPPSLTFRIWDIVLVEGNPRMFIRVALAVIALSKDKLESWTMEDILLWFQYGFAQPKNGLLDDEEKVLDTALNFKFSRRSMERYATKVNESSRGAGGARKNETLGAQDSPADESLRRRFIRWLRPSSLPFLRNCCAAPREEP